LFPKIIAHRGASLARPENTLAAFSTALEQGANGLELDLQMSGDGALLVIHDETLDRTTSGKGYLHQKSLAEIRALDAGAWFSEQYRGERVPLIQEVLELVHNKDILLNIELKNGIVPYHGMEEKLIQVLDQYPEQQVIVSSFNHHSLHKLKLLKPGLDCGALYIAGFIEPWHYARQWGFAALHPIYLNIIPDLVTGCRTAGIRLYPWTVDDDDVLQKMVLSGVDGIITNAPERLVKIREGM
jgi:glycerophosphoryl diester phosphodiesterase